MRNAKVDKELYRVICAVDGAVPVTRHQIAEEDDSKRPEQPRGHGEGFMENIVSDNATFYAKTQRELAKQPVLGP